MDHVKRFLSKFAFSSVHKEYLKLRDKNNKNFFKVLLYILIFQAVLGIAQSIGTGLLKDYLKFSGILAACLLVLKFGFKFRKYVDYIVAILAISLYVNDVVRHSNVLMQLPILPASLIPNIYYTAYFTGLTERIIILELTRIELKLAFSFASFVARWVMFKPPPPLGVLAIFLNYLVCVFVDIRRERNDRSMFKSFFEYREELMKFKNLMISQIPTNIIILTKDLRRKLLINELFQQTFQVDATDEYWDPSEWFRLFHVDKDSLDTEVSMSLTDNPDLEQCIEVLYEKDKVNKDKQNSTFVMRWGTPGSDDEKIFQTKVFTVTWDGRDGIVVILNDVTQQYANLSLKVADANKDKMIAMVSHELRNPLNGIQGMIAIMEKKIHDSEVKKYLAVCKNSGKLLLNLVNSILDLGQIRNNKFKLNLSKGNLQELLNEIILLFSFQFQQKNLYLKVETHSHLPKSIITDLNRLRQILINLVANALKFTFEGGVTISVSKDETRDENLLFKVSDTGLGIKEDDMKKLFKMYGKLQQTDKNVNTEGIGLGLTISDHLVRLLAANQDTESIHVESEFGKGSCFSFSVKADLEMAMEKGDTHDLIQEYSEDSGGNSVGTEGNKDIINRISSYMMQSNASYKISSGGDVNTHQLNSDGVLINQQEDNLRLPSIYNRMSSFPDGDEEDTLFKQRKGMILLVDDSPFNLMVSRNFIESLGYEVHTALNGKQAVEMMKKSMDAPVKYDMVFMDCQMPVMDGYEATTILRSLMKRGEVPEIPIIALSANDSEEDLKKCKDVGMIENVIKPVTEACLKAILDKYRRPRVLTTS